MASGEDYPPMNRLTDVMGALAIDDESRSGGAGESSSSEDIPMDSVIIGNGPVASGCEDDDASLLAYRWGINRHRRRPRRDPSPEQIHANLIAGPPMMDFHEPLLIGPAEDVVAPNAINSGDIGPGGREVEHNLAHGVISNNSFEDLQSVVSQLGLETSLQQKASCHSPHGQGPCCRHAVHNISLESLDLGIGLGQSSHCCNHAHQYRFKRGMNKRCSCQF